DNGGMGVPGDNGPIRLDQVDVPGALDVPRMGTLAPGHEVGRATHRAEGPDRAVDAPRDPPLGPREELVVAGHRPSLGPGPAERQVLDGRGTPDEAAAFPTATPTVGGEDLRSTTMHDHPATTAPLGALLGHWRTEGHVIGHDPTSIAG